MTIRFNDEEASQLAAQLMPHILREFVNKPLYWGDPKRVRLGKNISLVNTLFNTVSGDVYIEDFVFFGHNVCVLTGTHAIDQYDLARQKSVPTEGRDIHIEQGVWISSNSTILGPCRIGRNSVIGVGSVVISDVRPGWFYAGIPARPIKPVSSEYAPQISGARPYDLRHLDILKRAWRVIRRLSTS